MNDQLRMQVESVSSIDVMAAYVKEHIPLGKKVASLHFTSC